MDTFTLKARKLGDKRMDEPHVTINLDVYNLGKGDRQFGYLAITEDDEQTGHYELDRESLTRFLALVQV